MTVKLTESAIAKAIREVTTNGTRRDLIDAGCRGLRLRIFAGGTKTWALACRDRHGRMRTFRIGAYPDNGIREAREEARRVREAVRAGADPVADRRRDRAIGRDARAGIGTLEAVLNIYEANKGRTLKSWTHSRKRVDRVFAPLMGHPVAGLTAADLQMLADGYRAQQSAAFAVRTIRPALKWAAKRGHVATTLAALQVPVPVKARRRVLSRGELAALLPAVRASSRPHAALIQFLLLTLARLNEATAARWRDVSLDAGTWTIPVTKNGEIHVVPLPRQAVALLRDRLPKDADGNSRLERPDALVFATGNGTALGNWDRETKSLHSASGTAGWTRHDLRRTGATTLGELGELPDIIEAALNHTSIRSPLASTYNRSRYRPQVAAALQRLADALDGIETGAATVLPFRHAGS